MTRDIENTLKVLFSVFWISFWVWLMTYLTN